jgi:hypothetical protein
MLAVCLLVAGAMSFPMGVVPAEAPPPPAGDPALQNFFRRFDDVGIRTATLRRLSAQVGVKFGYSGGGEAQYGFILNNIHLRDELRGEDGAVRYGLGSAQCNDIIHEFSHAAVDMILSGSEPPGTPEREHYDAWRAVASDLRDLTNFRFIDMKADEVIAYTIGRDVSEVLIKVDEILRFNTDPSIISAVGRPAGMPEQEYLSGKLILIAPGMRVSQTYRAALAPDVKLGRISVSGIAKFHEPLHTHVLRWKDRDPVRRNIHRYVLGLDLPDTVCELVERLNTLENEWIRAVRLRVAEERARRKPPSSALRLPKGIEF